MLQRAHNAWLGCARNGYYGLLHGRWYSTHLLAILSRRRRTRSPTAGTPNRLFPIGTEVGRSRSSFADVVLVKECFRVLITIELHGVRSDGDLLSCLPADVKGFVVKGDIDHEYLSTSGNHSFGQAEYPLPSRIPPHSLPQRGPIIGHARQPCV